MASIMQNYSEFSVATVIMRSVEFKEAASTSVRPFVSPVTVLFVTVLVCLCVVYNRRRAHMVQLISKIPGPAAMPIIGNMVECNVQHDGWWQLIDRELALGILESELLCS